MLKTASLLLVMLAGSALYGGQGAADAAAKNRTAIQARKAAAQPLLADAPTREEVLKLFEVMQLQKNMDDVVLVTKNQGGELAEQMLRDRLPDSTPEQKKEFQAMVDNEMRVALGPEAIHEMIEATVPVYQKHLSKSDVDAMIAFYSSPVGQKILREQTAMVQESMAATSGIQQKIARTLFQKIDEQVEKMAAAAKEHPKSN